MESDLHSPDEVPAVSSGPGCGVPEPRPMAVPSLDTPTMSRPPAPPPPPDPEWIPYRPVGPRPRVVPSLEGIGPWTAGPEPVPERIDPVAPTGDRAAAGPSRLRWWAEWVAVVAVAVVLALGIRGYVAQVFYIPSGSMLPTLQVGDRIVVDKLSYHLHGVHRGDVVVFRRPPLEPAAYSDLVKRVIGLPGDTVASIGGRIYIDGKPLAEPWLPRPTPLSAPSPVLQPFSLNHPYTVPPGHYFVMGDNRTDSEDSRYFGPIAADLLVGKMSFVAWPLDDAGWLVVLGTVAALLVVALVVVALRPRSAAPVPARSRPASPLRGSAVPGTR